MLRPRPLQSALTFFLSLFLLHQTQQQIWSARLPRAAQSLTTCDQPRGYGPALHRHCSSLCFHPVPILSISTRRSRRSCKSDRSCHSSGFRLPTRRRQSSHRSPQDPCDLPCYLHDFFSHPSVPASLISSLFIRARRALASGSLHLLCPLPGTLFPQTVIRRLSHLLQVLSQQRHVIKAFPCLPSWVGLCSLNMLKAEPPSSSE